MISLNYDCRNTRFKESSCKRRGCYLVKAWPEKGVYRTLMVTLLFGRKAKYNEVSLKKKLY